MQSNVELAVSELSLYDDSDDGVEDFEVEELHDKAAVSLRSSSSLSIVSTLDWSHVREETIKAGCELCEVCLENKANLMDLSLIHI